MTGKVSAARGGCSVSAPTGAERDYGAVDRFIDSTLRDTNAGGASPSSAERKPEVRDLTQQEATAGEHFLHSFRHYFIFIITFAPV